MLLVVDDDEDLLEMFATLFSRAKIPHTCVSSLAQVKGLGDALQQLDTALLDINLGAGQPSGVDVARWLRESGFTPRIIFITGHAPDHPLVKKAAGESGRVIEKPIIPSDLLQILRSA